MQDETVRRLWLPVVLAAVAGTAAGVTTSGGPGWTVLAGVALSAGLVWAVRPASVPAITPAVLVVTAAIAGAASADQSLEGAVLGTVAALGIAVVAALPAGIGAVVRQRAAHRRQGWELARAVAAEEEARVESAVAQERATMAGEVHDRLGHQLTLIAVRLGRMTLDPDVPAPIRDTIEEIRADAADAAAELGETVQFLRAGSARAPAVQPLGEIVESARRSGLQITATLAEGLEGRLGAHARAAVERVVTEALTNAAKHAPESVITVEADVDDGIATVTVRNAPHASTAETPAPSSGHGLASLRHRLEVLGGRLDVESERGFSLRAWVPADAAPSPAPNRTQQVVLQERAMAERARRTRRLAWTVPVALSGAAVTLAVAYFVYVTAFSVLSPGEFSRIRIGMDQAEAEELLPSVEMLDAPRDVSAPRPGETCRFYEASLSFFARDDVYRVCFGDGTVATADIISAP
ncbi:two-component sensor histidine kinase [Nonomuraea terrae]|uniref:histidine kinase n=1 Tax=Nonomuraea terrae TaxID=2530383 RepID=A0A4R4XU23_9ACTN|nr:histidine kinase [Nonomuraea terrae]TDD34833.1 two-component sensor histidine kinase [Nonomuraea terrae]